MAKDTSSTIPNAFLWRRLHSLVGLALVLFLIEHLFTNSQAALPISGSGSGFISGVNWIHGLPFLPAIEVGFLLIPFAIHIAWGIKYLRQSKLNAFPGEGSRPTLTEYARNHAYSWQRLTSWFLIVAVIWHVWEMRFEHQPAHATVGQQEYYAIPLSVDSGLYTLASRLDVDLYDQEMIEREERRVAINLLRTDEGNLRLVAAVEPDGYDPKQELVLLQQRKAGEEEEWLHALQHKPLKEGEIMAVAPDFGTAILLMLRDTLKSPLTCVLYTFLVLAGVFHGFNGLWTWTITWGIALTPASQRLIGYVTKGLMALLTFLGLSAVWLTYWITLRQ